MAFVFIKFRKWLVYSTLSADLKSHPTSIIFTTDFHRFQGI
jgi:hypothetical protein